MRLKKIISLLCTIMICASTSVGAAGVKFLKIPDMSDGKTVANFYDSLINYVADNYKYDISKEELLSAAIESILVENPEMFTELCKGAFEALDENSKFYTKEEYSDVYSDVSGVYVGIGIYVSQEGTKIVLGEPIPGSPAEGSGLQVGDVIVAVDGVDVSEFALDRVTSMIKGVAGTTVKITVLRNGIEYTYDITRAEIKINPITYNIIEDTDIGYVKISSFNANTIEAFDDAMKHFADKGVKKVILDLRNNLGGYLGAAVAVASYFIPDGEPVVTIEYKNEEDNITHNAIKTDNKFKAVVLINGYSASASEVVSSALRDYGTGIIVGKRSYGKGTVQETRQLLSGHYLWMTFAEYYTPSHTPIHGVGVVPDFHVVNTKEKFDINTVKHYDVIRTLNVGDSGEDVYAVKERLKALGYTITVNDVYDVTTASIVEQFQNAVGLFPYGVADLTTQIKINDVLIDSDVMVDNQYEYALDLAKDMK